MVVVTQTCIKCSKQFLVIDAEQKFLSERGMPLPVLCPTDRQARRLELRGARELFKTKCSQCGKDIVISYDPTSATTPILCKADYDKYFEENDPIINEPLPGDTGQVGTPVPQPQPGETPAANPANPDTSQNSQ